MACGILVPWPGIKPVPPAMEAQSLNHWTDREVPLMQSWCVRSDMVQRLVTYTRIREARVQVPYLPLIWCVTLGK